MQNYPPLNSPVTEHKSRTIIPKKTLITLGILTLIAIGLGVLKYTYKSPVITSFEECVVASDSTTEDSYPPTCTTAAGQQFTQDITDQITPQPTPSPAAQTVNTKAFINPTTNWQILRRSIYQIETPQDWILTSSKNPLKLASPLNNLDTNAHQIEINTAKSELDLNAFVKEQEERAKEIIKTQFTWTNQALIIDNQPAIKVTTDSPGVIIYTKHPSSGHVITIGLISKPAQDNQLTTKILNSFKFIGSECPAACSINSTLDCPSKQYVINESDSCYCPTSLSCTESINQPATATPSAKNNSCVVTGCSSHICANSPVTTTCEYKTEYACYKNAECTLQPDGQCGWTQTETLTSCLNNARQ